MKQSTRSIPDSDSPALDFDCPVRPKRKSVRGMLHPNARHGHACRDRVSKQYQAWRGIMNRCYRVKTKGYPHYGGRGIAVCDRWRFGENGKPAFDCFLEDMGEPPTPGHSIERKNVNGNYEPSNCCWATIAEQSRNKTNSRWLTGFGKTQLLEDWAREYGIDPAVLYKRIVMCGKSVEVSVNPPEWRKLDADKVADIRRAYQSGGTTYQRLADKFGVSKSLIGAVVRGEWWKEPAG